MSNLELAMNRERFEELIWEAADSLPKFFKDRLKNVAIVVQDYPDQKIQRKFPGQLLLGLYHGVPYGERSVFAIHPQPDVIYIYKANIEAICRREEEIREQVRKTIMHEIGHYFGLNDEELRRLEEES